MVGIFANKISAEMRCGTITGEPSAHAKVDMHSVRLAV